MLNPSRIALALSLTIALGGCATFDERDDDYEYDRPRVIVAPPAPVYEYRGFAPGIGFIWIEGYWRWGGSRYVWIPGFWTPPRPGYVWIPYRWERDGPHWHSRGGHWSHEHDREFRPVPMPAPRPHLERPGREQPRYREPDRDDRHRSPDYRRDSSPTYRAPDGSAPRPAPMPPMQPDHREGSPRGDMRPDARNEARPDMRPDYRAEPRQEMRGEPRREPRQERPEYRPDSRDNGGRGREASPQRESRGGPAVERADTGSRDNNRRESRRGRGQNEDR